MENTRGQNTRSDSIDPDTVDSSPEGTNAPTEGLVTGESVAPSIEGSGQEIDPRDALIEEYRKEKEALLDRLLRRQAEFENYRRRTEKEKQDAAGVIRSGVLRELLPVLDACERALKSLPNTEETAFEADPYRSGLELIHKQFLDTLAKFKVFPIEAVGRPFDPNLHHAIMREETMDYPENQVTEDLLTGYTFEDRLLRPTQVKVSIAPKVEESEE